ncbi:MAG: beta-eliminating lyase-related protein [Candidatus Solibacter sp.]
MRRRSFLASPLLAAAPLAAGEEGEPRIYARGDGIPHTPAEYAQLLTTLTKANGVAVDDYSRGGVIEQLETRMAAVLGKEAAVWLPTGTLANHLAVRLLAGNRRRVLVQSECHLFNDCGDCAQTLSGLNLMPLAPGRSTFTLQDVERVAYEGSTGRVEVPIGAVQVETPVRRRNGERFDFAEMKKVAAWARAHNAGLHLDGARLLLECAYSGHSAKEYAALFDTVYISMYKYFNSGSGAILAGPKAQLANLYHTRRMFGAGMPHCWTFAAVALHYLTGFEARFKTAVDASEQVIAALGKDSNFGIERIPNGTNIFRLRVFGVNAPVYQNRLENAGITTVNPTGDWFHLQVNETWNRLPATAITDRFKRALT